MRRLWLCALALAACHKGSEKPAPCAPGLKSSVEVRDGEGQLELAVKPGDMPDAWDLCNPSAQRVARLVSHGELWTLDDRSGAPMLRLQKDSPTDWSASTPKGQLFRVHVNPTGETRVLKPDGIPYGSVMPRDGGATLYSPGSAPVGAVAPRGDDQVVSGADGATRLYVVPSASPAAAGLLGIEGLDLPERVALYFAASKTSR